MIKKTINVLKVICITIFLFVVLLEVSYRYQWFDFYAAEYKFLNTNVELHSKKEKILICGDSFTAHPESFINYLRDSLTAFSVINAAVPGTGIKQHSIYMPGRIKEVQPEILIYQFYVGNDLFDITNPVGSPNISFLRKTYWFISDQLLVLSFLNFRLPGLRYKYYDDAGGSYQPKEVEAFSVNTYSKREKFNYKAEPKLIENTLFMEGGRKGDWEIFKTKFQKMSAQLPSTSRNIFVIIPHEAQTSAEAKKKHETLGAVFTNRFENHTNAFPLYAEISDLCKRENFEIIDFGKSISEGDNNIYYKNDPHLSYFGQHKLGKILVEEIIK